MMLFYKPFGWFILTCFFFIICNFVWYSMVIMFCFFIYNITWCMCYGIMDYILVGVLFFCICTTTYDCISYSPCNVYSYGFLYFPFILYFCVPISGCTQPHVLLFPNCVKFNNWDENFWGCMHMCFTICSYMCILKYVYMI